MKALNVRLVILKHTYLDLMALQLKINKMKLLKSKRSKSRKAVNCSNTSLIASQIFNWMKDMFQPAHEHHNTFEDITNRIKIELSDFEDKVNSTKFADWLSFIEEYFN